MVKLNLYSLLYNNDPFALKELQNTHPDLYEELNKPLQSGITNTFELSSIEKSDTIEYIKYFLVNKIIELLKTKKEGNKTCFYCFKDKDKNGNENVIINKVKKTNILKRFISLIFRKIERSR